MHAKKIRLSPKLASDEPVATKIVPVHSDCLKQIERYVENSLTADKQVINFSSEAPEGTVARKGAGELYKYLGQLANHEESKALGESLVAPPRKGAAEQAQTIEELEKQTRGFLSSKRMFIDRPPQKE